MGPGAGILRLSTTTARQGGERRAKPVSGNLPTVVVLRPPGKGAASYKAERIAEALGSTSLLDTVALGPEWVQWTLDGVIAHWPPDHLGNGWRSCRPDLVVWMGVSSNSSIPRSPFTLEIPDPSLQVREPFDSWAYRTLMRAASEGICVNYETVLIDMESKKLFEERCRDTEVRRGLSVPRPRTWLLSATGSEQRSEQLPGDARAPFIVKPDLGTQGYGITFAHSVLDVPEVHSGSVVQELVRNPVTLDGHKIDARAYVMVRTGGSVPLTPLPLVVIRRTIAPYEEGLPDAEISNLSYARRQGRSVQAILLHEVEPAALRDEIRQSIGATLTELFAMLSEFTSDRGFVGLWGVDLALRWGESAMESLVLELNTAPEIYRDHGPLDAAMDAMLGQEVAPLLCRYLSGEG
jgi:hypothetical protein